MNDRRGFPNKRWWKELDREGQIEDWNQAPANHPITNVSWYDAMAFCRWLTDRLGYEVRLPHEREWQWAAQSANRRFNYPWGTDPNDSFANTNRSGINGTSAVGVYPRGNSHQGVSDLSGNVWEWCLNEYEDIDRIAPGGEAARALRGGSWLLNPGYSRAGNRDFDDPQGRNDDLGFRVVCRSPITGR